MTAWNWIFMRSAGQKRTPPTPALCTTPSGLACAAAAVLLVCVPAADSHTCLLPQPCCLLPTHLHALCSVCRRLWVQRRSAALRRLTISFPGEPYEQWDAVQQRLVPLVASLTTTLAGSLHSLDLQFTCYAPW